MSEPQWGSPSRHGEVQEHPTRWEKKCNSVDTFEGVLLDWTLWSGLCCSAKRVGAQKLAVALRPATSYNGRRGICRRFCSTQTLSVYIPQPRNASCEVLCSLRAGAPGVRQCRSCRDECLLVCVLSELGIRDLISGWTSLEASTWIDAVHELFRIPDAHDASLRCLFLIKSMWVV